ncbi:MAG TPA: magnesium-translocating P-type ATPase, partial [Pseudorhodoferax sp.]|nr:magnesium-translocating P-type ATPase [Pseudorhodoferax sp.]
CLSVPGLRGVVNRHRAIRYQGLDPEGRPIDRSVEGFHARVVQHECDQRLVPLDAKGLARVRAVTQDLNEQGLRVVAVAMKELPASQSAYAVADEAGLTLVGYIAFLDPPKESTAPALRALAAHGVQVKVLTGDSELVAAHVCGRVGLAHSGFLLGPQVEKMDDTALAGAVETHQLFARLTPQDKERIVRALRANGHVVGFMGDGINDAPALRAADIGISVDSGVDIAKEAADIILLEKSLMVLEEGVVEGRKTFSNMLKYIRMTASSNFGNVFSVLVGSAFLPFLPMLPLQLLVQNLLYDISQIAIPFDDVDRELVAKPLQWKPADIGRFMVFFGPISSVFDICTYLLMWHVFGASTAAAQTLFQSGWFVVGLLTQTLIVHMIRTPRLPFVESRAAWPLLLTTLLIMAAGIALPMGPLAAYFGLQALPLAFFPWLVGILLGYALLTTAMKKLYIRRFGWQ